MKHIYDTLGIRIKVGDSLKCQNVYFTYNDSFKGGQNFVGTVKKIYPVLNMFEIHVGFFGIFLMIDMQQRDNTIIEIIDHGTV